MAATTEPTSTAIEAFFRPSTRFKDSVNRTRGAGPFLPRGCTELELLPGLSPEDALLSGGRNTWEDFCRFLRGKVVWTTPYVYLTSPGLLHGKIFLHSKLYISVTKPVSLGSLGSPSVLIHSGTPSAASSTCECMVRLLGTCGQHEVRIGYRYGTSSSLPVTVPTLSRFLEQSRNNLGHFILEGIVLNEDQIRALATLSGSGLKVILKTCRLTEGSGCPDAFIECLQSDRGPTGLDSCYIDRRILAQAITGNTRVVNLKLCHRPDIFPDALFQRAISHNRGLANLDMSRNAISDEQWSVLCESLRVHPTITTLVINETHPNGRGRINYMTDAHKTRRTRAIANMLQENTILHTIQHNDDEFDSGCYDEFIRPRLETNLYRPRVLAIKKADDGLFRRKVLGRALSLHSVRSKTNLIWMFLSHNVDVACGGGNG
jgi:hypothetical protein